MCFVPEQKETSWPVCCHLSRQALPSLLEWTFKWRAWTASLRLIWWEQLYYCRYSPNICCLVWKSLKNRKIWALNSHKHLYFYEISTIKDLNSEKDMHYPQIHKQYLVFQHPQLSKFISRSIADTRRLVSAVVSTFFWFCPKTSIFWMSELTADA